MENANPPHTPSTTMEDDNYTLRKRKVEEAKLDDEEFEENFPRVLGYPQVCRDKQGHIIPDDDRPINLIERKRARMAGKAGKTPWPIIAFRQRTEAKKMKERANYIAACPTSSAQKNPMRLQEAIKDWDDKEAANGATHILECPYGFDGDEYFGAIDPPFPGNIAIPNWACGKGFHALHDPYNHLEGIRRLCKEADEKAGKFVYLTRREFREAGEFVHTTRREFAAGSPYKDTVECTDAMMAKLEFAAELNEMLERMCEDCLNHLIFDLDDDSLAFFCSALSRIPFKKDRLYLEFRFRLY